MDTILTTGILIFLGYILGEAVTRINLPKVSGYIIAGIILNPDLSGLVTSDYIEGTSPLINISLSVITFSIGGSLTIPKIRSSGKTIISLTLFESLFAYLFVFAILFVFIYFVFNIFDSIYAGLAVSLILASLAAPTDPSATLAVIQEYKAKGPVTSSILGVAAFDDIAGIILYTLTLAFSKMFIGDSNMAMSETLVELGRNIGGGILIGGIIGIIFNFITKLFNKDTEGSLIVVTIGMLLLCYGTVNYFNMDALLSTMTMGVVVVNFNKQQEKIFTLMERYTDELIFVIFFTLSGLHLQLSALSGSALLIGVYIIARAMGKYSGIYVGSTILKTPGKVKKYTAGGLFPQGGIVIGLALLIAKNDAFQDFSTLIIGIVIGAAIIHELLGPLISRYALVKAGEIPLHHKNTTTTQ